MKAVEPQVPEHLLDCVLRAIGPGLAVIDLSNGRAVYHNPALVELLGREVPSDAPESWVDYFGFRFKSMVLRENVALAENLQDPPVDGSPVSVEMLVDPPQDAPQRVVKLTTRRLVDAVRPHMLVVVEDITSERRREEDLQGFAMTVSHDLKAPLAGTLGWLEVAATSLEADDAEASSAALERARRAGYRMGQVMDEWLGYSVTRGGNLELTPVVLEDAVREIVDVLESGHPDVEPVIRRDLQHRVLVDPVLLNRVLANLIGNAIKHCPTGEAPEISIQSFEHEPGWVRVEVADRGKGIEAGQEQQIFSRFRRGDGTAGVPGLGLGLALCKSIVNQHGGWIAAETNEYGGATLSFTLPAG